MDEPENGSFAGDSMPNGSDTGPSAGLISQYVKDLSFENPAAPAIYQSQTAPAVDVQFNIGSNQVGDDIYEVILKIEVRANVETQVAFLVDLSYAGLFALRNVPAEQLQAFLLAEAPRLLFPFARRILADTVRDGSFPPLLLEPMDFNALYLQQLQSQATAGIQDFGQA
jgi:preprotein translocase subunit SecB